MDYNKLKVPELKALLQERSLAASGNKADLIARLTEDDASKATEAASVSEPPAPAPTEEEINWEEEAPAPAPATAPAEPKAADTPSDTGPSFSAGLGATDLEIELEKRRKRAAKFGISADNDATKALERAKRFGVDADDKSLGISMLDKELPERRGKRGHGQEARNGKRQRADGESSKEDPEEAAKRAARAKKFGQA